MTWSFLWFNLISWVLLRNYQNFHQSAWSLSQKHFQIGNVMYISFEISAHLTEFADWILGCRIPVLGKFLLTFMQRAGMRAHLPLLCFKKGSPRWCLFLSFRNSHASSEFQWPWTDSYTSRREQKTRGQNLVRKLYQEFSINLLVN